MIADYFAEFQLIKIVISFIDIILVWILVYTALTLLKGTRGIQLVKGILIILLLKFAFNIVGFKTMSYIIDQLVTWGFLAIIIIFQPEIRRTLEHIGRFDIMNILSKNQKVGDKEKTKVISMIVSSTKYMARRRIGALIVLQNTIGLDEYIESGIDINAEMSSELLTNLFIPNTPLHDGAVIISNNKIVAASCVLPLSDSRDIASSYGTRHRAAIGLSEITDAIMIAVSEETGNISIAIGGVLITKLTEEKLANFLEKNWLIFKKLGGFNNE